ncbi:MAG TPA: BON domain-containing protein [Hanamia sp.]|jgi:osmotically-inducible protein OsmY|nr:BON domain-containing protein [Hanamia sp.]
MENYNRSQHYRDDDRSSSNERNYDINWDRTYNRSSDDWRDGNYENPNVYSSDRERDYWKNRNSQLNDLNWNTSRNYNRDYNNDYNRNYNNDSNRKYYNDYDRRYNNDYSSSNYRNDYRNNYRNDNWRSSNDYNNRYRNEGWRDNNRNEGRDWWDRTKDEVASWFGDDDAQRRRDRDEREQGRHRGKGPKNYTRSQERIKEDVSDRLSDDSFLDASDIEVQVNGNEVTLSGQVDSRYSKHRAEDLAEDVTGVSHVQNNLRVKETTPQENRSNPKYNPVTSASANATKNKKETSNV